MNWNWAQCHEYHECDCDSYETQQNGTVGERSRPFDASSLGEEDSLDVFPEHEFKLNYLTAPFN